MNLIERIDVARARWNVLEHPFYRRWERGELTHEALSFYAAEYRLAVVALADAAAAGGDSEHAAEEAAHVGLWDDFAAALDAPLDREPTPESASCAEAWRPPDSLEARAVLTHEESQTRVAVVRPEESELFYQRWGHVMRAPDRFFNPQLSHLDDSIQLPSPWTLVR